MDQKLGSWAFIIGVIIAVIAGLAVGAMGLKAVEGWEPYVPLVLVIFGVVVGFLNIGDKEIGPFLLAAIALLLVGVVGTGLSEIDKVVAPLGTIMAKIVWYISVFAAPAALIVALIDFYRLAGTPKGVAVK